MSTTKVTERIGSDEYMREHGFHLSSQDEIAKYGRFVNREGTFSIFYGLIRTRARRLFVKVEEPEIVVVQIEGATAGVARQVAGRFYTRQSEATPTNVIQEQSGQWQRGYKKNRGV